MLTEEQYNKLKPHKESIHEFKFKGNWRGSDEVFAIHKQITGETTNMGCRGCKSAKLWELFSMIELYEKALRND